MKSAKHQILFTREEEIETVALAQLGLGNKAIMEATSLSPCKITYRLSKWKRWNGYRKGETPRSEWRNGTSDLFRQLKQAIMPGLTKDISQAAKQIARPEPELAPEGNATNAKKHRK